MHTPAELTEAFWSHLRSEMTVMAGLAAEDGHMRPLTAQLDGDGDHGPIWFFTAKDTDLLEALGGTSAKGSITMTSKSHDLFACVHGTFVVDNDRAVIDRLWNRYVAAWYEKGKDDPKLALLRFDPQKAEIWENATSLWAGFKMLIGADPKEDYEDKVAKVPLR